MYLNFGLKALCNISRVHAVTAPAADLSIGNDGHVLCTV